MNAKQQKNAQQKSGSPLEWAIAALGGALVLATVTVLAIGAFRSNGDTPDIIIEPLEIHQVQTGYLLSFRARNTGGQTAAGVIVEGTLARDGEELERAETTLDYVPEHSHHEGGLFFSNDPAQGRLDLRALGYSVP